MKSSHAWLPLAALAVCGVMVVGTKVVRASDHFDSPSVMMNPATDLTDVYAWMSSDGTKLNLVENVYPGATTTSKFATSTLYTIHVGSRMQFGGTEDSMDTDIRCTFDGGTPQKVSCWVGDDDPALDYVTGDASSTNGITSADGKLKVFTGLRADPFFLNFDGFNHTVSTVESAASSLTFDAYGCPQVNAMTSMALVNQLKTSADGGAPVNAFGGSNVLSIVVQVDKAMVSTNRGGPIVAVLGSTSAL